MLGLLSACQPALNWRESQPAGSGAAALFPCKPELAQRPAQEGQGAMGLAQCEAAGQRFSLSWADAPDPTLAGAALKAMPVALAAKLGQPLPPALAVSVAGMTPMPEAVQHRWRSDGASTYLAVFAHGGRVYQALVTAGRDDAAWEVFIGGLRVGSAAEAAR
ncbi:hypothetical protein DBR42_11310 [Pelomonas sp. HMWF004]|nr:hypothetical protein DBR42_11310 [Pelomonas sp. HMWF004]